MLAVQVPHPTFDTGSEKALWEFNKRVEAGFLHLYQKALRSNYNQGYVTDCHKIGDFFGQWKGEKAVVVGGGESAHKYMEDIGTLRKLGYRCLVCDSMAKHIPDADFAVSFDPQAAVERMFNFDLSRLKVVLSLVTHNTVYRKFNKENIYVYGYKQPNSPFWVDTQAHDTRVKDIPNLFSLRPGFFVTFTAIDLAINMGASEVVLIGNELGWVRGEEVPYQGDVNVYCVQLENGTKLYCPEYFLKGSYVFSSFPGDFPGIRFVDCSGGIVQKWEKYSMPVYRQQAENKFKENNDGHTFKQ